MTKEKVYEIFKGVVDDENILDNIISLSKRWGDEKGFEDWKNYEKIMMRTLSGHDVEFLKGTKRPFGFVIRVGNSKIAVMLRKKPWSAWLTGKIV